MVTKQKPPQARGTVKVINGHRITVYRGAPPPVKHYGSTGALVGATVATSLKHW